MKMQRKWIWIEIEGHLVQTCALWYFPLWSFYEIDFYTSLVHSIFIIAIKIGCGDEKQSYLVKADRQVLKLATKPAILD